MSSKLGERTVLMAGGLLFALGGCVSESAFEPTPRCPLSYSAIGCVCLET